MAASPKESQEERVKAMPGAHIVMRERERVYIECQRCTMAAFIDGIGDWKIACTCGGRVFISMRKPI